MEAQHCVVHATGDLKVSVDGVRLDIPESHRQSKLNDLMLNFDESNCSSSDEPCKSFCSYMFALVLSFVNVKKKLVCCAEFEYLSVSFYSNFNEFSRKLSQHVAYVVNMRSLLNIAKSLELCILIFQLPNLVRESDCETRSDLQELKPLDLTHNLLEIAILWDFLEYWSK